MYYKAEVSMWVWILGLAAAGAIVFSTGIDVSSDQISGVSRQMDAQMFSEIVSKAKIACESGEGTSFPFRVSVSDNIKAIYPAEYDGQEPPDKVSVLISEGQMTAGNFLCIRYFDDDEPHCEDVGCTVNMTYMGQKAMDESLASLVGEEMEEEDNFDVIIEKQEEDMVYIGGEQTMPAAIEEEELCGNGDVDAGEECDGSGHTCEFAFESCTERSCEDCRCVVELDCERCDSDDQVCVDDSDWMKYCLQASGIDCDEYNQDSQDSDSDGSGGGDGDGGSGSNDGCTDSDGGDNPYVKGTVTIGLNGVPLCEEEEEEQNQIPDQEQQEEGEEQEQSNPGYTDYCKDERYLVEYICNGDNHEERIHDCVEEGYEMCIGGRCTNGGAEEDDGYFDNLPTANVDCSGSNDVTTINNAINSIDKGTVFLKSCTYNIGGIIRVKSNIRLLGEDGTVLKFSESGIITTGTGGYSSSTISLASNAELGSKQIQLSSVSGLKAGDHIKVSDDFKVPYEGNTYKNGEIVEITAISGNTVTLDRSLYDDYLTSRNARVRKIAMLENVRFENIEFQGAGMGTSSTAMRMYATEGMRITGCELHHFGSRAVSLFDCLDVYIGDNIFRSIFLDGTGYGIAITNACDNIVIMDNSFLEKGRHYIAIVASGGGATTDGYARHVDIINNIFRDCDDEAINSHHPSDAVFRIIGNEIYDSRKGIELARSESVIENNKIVRCKIGIDMRDIGTHTIHNNYFEGNTRSMMITSTKTLVKGNEFNNAGSIVPGPNMVIEDNVFKNYGGLIFEYYVDKYYDYDYSNIKIINNECDNPPSTALDLRNCDNIVVSGNGFDKNMKFTDCNDVTVNGEKIY